MSGFLYVVDASVFASVLVKDQFYERALRFILTFAGRLATLDLAVVESANTLWWHACLLKRIPADRYEVLRESVKPLVQKSAKLYPSIDFLESAMNIASAYTITVYDALYVSLAQSLGCKLASFDRDLEKRLREKGVDLVESP